MWRSVLITDCAGFFVKTLKMFHYEIYSYLFLPFKHLSFLKNKLTQIPSKKQSFSGVISFKMEYRNTRLLQKISDNDLNLYKKNMKFAYDFESSFSVTRCLNAPKINPRLKYAYLQLGNEENENYSQESKCPWALFSSRSYQHKPCNRLTC